ncbi:capsular biosynthesis protein [Rhizobium sp. NTR19]|uniref:Capsular biosynthesis protein n=1 Tax=Neorhizobium turbinariae TaxID=2937795 RepID=A0ABT0IXW6_9HYPH|nr:capsular biosynthesis protein [Neorhizobium turbinariae]MCK8782695.1 capsular biosynthesis protein [Neorhizobium turbinariae]
MTNVLFLQGPPSIFWRELAEGFEAQGIETSRVNFSFGDQLYWRKRGAINYRGSVKAWPRFLAELIRRKGITDILYYADRLPYHRLAARVARKLGVKCHAVEFGYLRPDWITLERDGMGRFSHFPSDPEQIRQIAAKVGAPDLEPRYGHTFNQEATNEVVYNLATYFGRGMFPLYHADKYYDALIDYLSWLPRAFRPRHDLPEGYFSDKSKKTYLVALQLQSDYQIRANSPFQHLSQMLEQVVQSFALHAPNDSRLIVKQHPLDNDLEGWRKVVTELATRYRISKRVVFIERGDLGYILKNVQAVIVCNSTTALHSLRAGIPTIALGTAIYDIPGLTHQKGLDSFWRTPEPIDQRLLADFIKAIAATIQIKGNFYHKTGRKVAIESIISRVVNDLVNQPDAFVEKPPRAAWKRLPLSPERKAHGASVVAGGFDLPGKEILGTRTDSVLGAARADASERPGVKLR